MTGDPGRDPRSRHHVDRGEVAPPSVPFVVTSGGIPTGAEEAAIGRALARVIDAAGAQAAGTGTGGLAGAGPIAGSRHGATRTHVPAWTRAALTEATTSVTITSPTELPS